MTCRTCGIRLTTKNRERAGDLLVERCLACARSYRRRQDWSRKTKAELRALREQRLEYLADLESYIPWERAMIRRFLEEVQEDPCGFACCLVIVVAFVLVAG